MDIYQDKYIGTMLDGRYEILELIGRGGMANVYKAMCHRLHRYVAVKILHDDMLTNEELRGRFHAESHAVAMLSHPNIVTVYDVGRRDDLEYIVMELVEGITLKEYLRQNGRLPFETAVDISMQIAGALSHAHDKGIIHRDIKPQNIMLLKDGLVKVADFGIAAIQTDRDTPENETVGSIHYIAPEQMRGGVADKRSDVYSLGIAMYEMLTGKLPYTGKTDMEVAVKHMNVDAVPPHELVPGLPPDLERIVLKAMNTELTERYQTVQELLDDLDGFKNAIIAAQLKGDDEPEQPEEEMEHSSHAAFVTGIVGVLVIMLAAFAFINRYFLMDLFASPEELDIPDFKGRYYEDVINDPDYLKLFRFTVTFKIDPNTEYGMIIAQNPEAEHGKALTDQVIDVELTVSSGEAVEDNNDKLVSVPNVINTDQASAVASVKKAGFQCETVALASSSVTEGYVISTEPAAGEMVQTGSTVRIIVSTGPNAMIVPVPQLKGLTEEAAIAKIESNNLSVGSVEQVESDLEAGTVVWQSISAGTEVEAHYKISIQVSSGPDEIEEG